MKSWKQTRRERKRSKYRKYIKLKIDIDKKCLSFLRDESRRTNISMLKLIEQAVITGFKELKRKNNEARNLIDSN